MPLTNAEEQVIKILWKLDKAFIRDILNEFPEPRPASTTVITLLKRMSGKGYVGFRQCGNSREYFPLVSKSEYFANHLNELIRNFFNNSTAQFASFFASETGMNPEELRELRKIVDSKIDSSNSGK